MSELLIIKALSVTAEDKELLHEVTLTVGEGETHVLMGHNGAGKSTLGCTIMGSPEYAVTGGKIIFDGEDITAESADKRAKRGIFLSFQNPIEIPGIPLSGFSGGEKKKAEILQLLMLRPKLAILDETDSGLDVDAIKTVSKGIEEYRKSCGGTLLIITHNSGLLEGLHIDRTHILSGGKIAKEGGGELAFDVLANGFEKFTSEV